MYVGRESDGARTGRVDGSVELRRKERQLNIDRDRTAGIYHVRAARPTARYPVSRLCGPGLFPGESPGRAKPTFHCQSRIQEQRWTLPQSEVALCRGDGDAIAHFVVQMARGRHGMWVAYALSCGPCQRMRSEAYCVVLPVGARLPTQLNDLPCWWLAWV